MRSSPSASPLPLPEPEVEAPKERGGPLIRLRSLLFVGLIVLAGWLLHPRAQAAWKLHSTATDLANYALCMVGPTGPALLRDNSPEFSALVRRRLIGADAGDRPFQDCAKLARSLTGSETAERAHRAPAWAFAEYAGGSKGEVSLSDLGVSGHHLAELAKSAWPFVRGGYVKLVKPSIAAHEAVHPVDTAKPAVGRGLPGWRAGYRAVGEVDGVLTVAFGKAANLSVYQSSDGGLSFRPVPARGTEAFAERCPAGARSFTLALSEDSSTLMVASQSNDAAPQAAPLAPADAELLSFACDAKAALVAYRREAEKKVQLALCNFRGRCAPVTLPRFGAGGVEPGPGVDVARIDGATIVSVPMGGIVRVASSRDDGHTWTPFTVAYDDAAHPEVRAETRLPTRLLALGKRLLLHGAALKPGQSYSVIVSDDLGASWRTPDSSPEPVAAK